MDAAESERRRAGSVAHDVRSWKPSTPVVAIEENLGAGRDFFVLRRMPLRYGAMPEAVGSVADDRARARCGTAAAS